MTRPRLAFALDDAPECGACLAGDQHAHRSARRNRGGDVATVYAQAFREVFMQLDLLRGEFRGAATSRAESQGGPAPDLMPGSFRPGALVTVCGHCGRRVRFGGRCRTSCAL